MDIVLYKTMTLSIAPTMQEDSMKKGELVGGPLLQSPDLNPIENLWHELKEFIRQEVKPKTKQELIDGIKGFWGTVSVNKCQKYIGHLRRVIPAVIQCEGSAAGY